MESTLGNLLDDAAEHLAGRRYKEAHAACLVALNADPQDARAYFLLGVLTADHTNHRKACELFGRAIALAPDQPSYHAERARSRVALFDRDGALDDARMAAQGKGLAPRTLSTIGVVHSRLGLHAEALPYFRRAIDMEPDNPAFLYNLGAALQFMGKFEAAEAAFRKAIAIEPGNVRAWSSLVLMQKQTPERNDVDALKGLFPRLVDADDRLHVGHAIGKAKEDLGDVAAQMAWLDKAKELKRKAIPYDSAEVNGLFAAAAATAKATTAGSGHPDGAPIFIVGLPRTGTTLLDRILSSHSDVASAGELGDFSLELKRATGTPSAHVLDVDTLVAALRVDLPGVGERYIARARRVVGEAPRFIDKMPLNFFYAPLIVKALPEARIICLRRNPADTVLSNYRQLFATTFRHYNYAYDLAWAADYYARFETLIAGFRESLPSDRFTEVWYEDLVSDIETEARRLLAFCGLGWQDECLLFHRNAAPVATASASQVRQPLYGTSVQRWRRYRDHIGPALAVLAERGIAYE
jgi:tetratricopeptide (TPR) repeat protein